MVTWNAQTDEARLRGLPKAIKDAAEVEQLLKAAQLRLGNLFGAISEAISSKARTEAAEIVDQLGQLAETFTKQGEESVESENQTLEVASNALAHILRAAQLELERSVIAGKDDHEVREKAQERMEKLVREVERGRGRLEQEALEATHPPTPPQTSMRGPSIAVKWVAADNEGGILRASEEALRVLKDVRESKPLNVLTILGPARRGKSFLMNALTGRGGVFPVSPAAVPCTAGADLSPILMPFSTFERGGRGSIARSSSVSAQPTIAFVDMEGQGDKSTEHGVRLATTFLVISKVIIYNWPGLPNKQTMLTDLVLMIKAAEKVLTGDSNDDHDDEDGETDGEGNPTFGHLIILLRDVEGKAEEIEHLVLRKEATRRLKHDEKLDAGERNTIRDGLRNAFESITVHTMPLPHPNIAGGAVPLSDVAPDFTASLEELRGIIAEKLAAPHTFAGQPIAGGERLHATVVGLCEAVNSTGEICPPSVLVTIDTRMGDAAVQKALVEFDSMVGPTLGGKFALTSVETENAVRGARTNALELFDEATKGIAGNIKEGKRVDLENQLTPKVDVATQNQEARRQGLKSRIHAMVSQHEAEIAEEAKSLGVPLEEKALELEWMKLVSSHFSSLDGDMKNMVARKTDTGEAEVREDLLEELGWALSRKDFEGRVQDTYHFVQELNRSAVAGKEDRKAKEEAEQKMGELAEQAKTFKKQVDEALAEAKKAQELANDAQARAAREAQQSQSQAQAMMMMAMMGAGGGGGGFGGGGGGGAPPGMGAGHPGMGGHGMCGGGPGRGGWGRGGQMRFYAGGQFTPGGGRAPRGGVYMRSNR